MRILRPLSASLILLAVVVLAGGCTSTSTEPTPAPRPTPQVIEPEPEPMEEEVVTEPETRRLVSEEVREELPRDIQELNRRGYLKDVFFDTDSYELKPEAREALAANSSWLQSFTSIRILVEGHCDERNTRDYNIALGDRRATAVRDYLVFLGIPADRIKTVSYGEERPFAVGHDESAWRLNRRAHFVITAR
jgi:peptidoglycan-associated lipoprotein